jgi:pimeloyl-ACP methyl ester carboxylesterase
MCPPPAATQAFHERSLVLHVPGFEIPAAVTVPGTGAPRALVVVIPGSLFSDVNGDFPAWNVRPHVYAHLARQLAERGLAVYRFAKLGPGTGSVETDPDAAVTVKSWDGRMVIARAALAAARQIMGEGELPERPLILAGHSEGAVVASVLAATGSVVDGLVLLSGPSVGLLGIMREQVTTMTAPEVRATVLAALEEAIACVRRGEPIPERLRDTPGVGGLAAMDERGLKYMRDTDAVDPAATLARVAAPVLIF